MRVLTILIVLFIASPVARSLAESAEPDPTNALYFVPGWMRIGCGTKGDAYGTSVAKVAENEIAAQNKVTNCTNCMSPAVLISVNEEAETYVEKSVCTGSYYTTSVELVDASVINNQNTGSPKCSN